MGIVELVLLFSGKNNESNSVLQVIMSLKKWQYFKVCYLAQTFVSYSTYEPKEIGKNVILCVC